MGTAVFKNQHVGEGGGKVLSDREADILYINERPPYPEQESEELGDDLIARINPETGEVENIEVLFFSTRLLRDELFEVPLALIQSADRPANDPHPVS